MKSTSTDPDRTHFVAARCLDVILREFFPGREWVPSTPFDALDEVEGISLRPAHLPVTADEAARYKAGLAACRDAGISTRSREGLAIRWQVFTGLDTLPQTWVTWLDQVDQARADTAEAEAALAAAEDALEAHLDGWEPVPPRAHQQGYVISALPRIAVAGRKYLYQIDEHTRLVDIEVPGTTGHREIVYRDDITAAERADWAMRQAITGYRYSPALTAAMTALDMPRLVDQTTGHNVLGEEITVPGMGRYVTYAPTQTFTWFGGSRLPEIAANGYVVPAYLGAASRTGAELTTTLEDWLQRTEAAHPEAAPLVEEARAALRAAPIEHVVGAPATTMEDSLRGAESTVRATRGVGEDALHARNDLVARAIGNGITKYRIAQLLEVSQHAVTLMARESHDRRQGKEAQ